jgi:excinuclease UvrABC nuclease subunit
MQEIDIVDIVAKSHVRFMLSTILWNSFDSDVLSVVSHTKSWHEVKLLARDGKRNSQLSTIPNNQGGIYLFLAKPNILPESHLFLMYIGRAHISNNQNLRKRCSQYPAEKTRPKIKRMIEQWGQYLYIRYLPLDDNTIIDTVEKELINKILPPFNDEIPDKKTSAAIKAFTM